jgi:polar amino acid transport system permease protein
MRVFSLSDLGFLLLAARWTIMLSLVAFLGGGIVGVAIALMRVSVRRVPRWVAIGYIRVFQGTPLLLQLFLVFFGADLAGLSLSAWFSAALGLSLNAGAFLGEIWRGSIQAVPPGQIEAARALGLRYRALMLRVVLPQALRVAIPPTVGFSVNLIKSTSLAAIIGFVELTRAGQLLNNATFRPFLIFGQGNRTWIFPASKRLSRIEFQGLWPSLPRCEAAHGRKMGCSVPSAIALDLRDCGGDLFRALLAADLGGHSAGKTARRGVSALTALKRRIQPDANPEVPARDNIAAGPGVGAAGRCAVRGRHHQSRYDQYRRAGRFAAIRRPERTAGTRWL